MTGPSCQTDLAIPESVRQLVLVPATASQRLSQSCLNAVLDFMTVTLECGQSVVDLFIDRLFLKCSIRAKSISVSPMSKRCCTNARGRSASEADSSVSDLSAGRRHLGLELAKANVHRASQHDRHSLGCPAIFRGSER